MALGVRQREEASPRPSGNEPRVHTQVVPESLDVIEKVIRGVRREIDVRITGVRRAPAGVALIEEHDAIPARIEQTTLPRRRARPGAAVQEHGWLPGWIAGLLPVHPVPITDIEHPGAIRLNERVAA